MDFEPKVQLSGIGDWRNIDITPLVEYYPNKWFDLTAEIVLGYTKDDHSNKTYEVSPRLGIRWNIYGNLRQYIPDNNMFSFKRFNFATLFRYEYRSLYYKDKSSAHQSRLRVRLETKTAFNHENYTDDNTFYLVADAEQYFDFGDEVKEVFANKVRVRLGPGYTYDKTHRFEMLIIYDYARDTFEGDARNDAISVDFRYKRFF